MAHTVFLDHSISQEEVSVEVKWLYFWLCWVFAALWGLPLVAASRGSSSFRCAGFYCAAFRCGEAQALGAQASGSCGACIQLLYSLWHFLRLGIKPVSPVSQMDSYPLCHKRSHGKMSLERRQL